jgi:hypothetical protein
MLHNVSTFEPRLIRVAPTSLQSCACVGLFVKFDAQLPGQSLYVSLCPSETSAYPAP